MDVKFSQVLVFIIGGQSIFDYDIDLDESSEQGNKSKVQTHNLASTLLPNN